MMLVLVRCSSNTAQHLWKWSLSQLLSEQSNVTSAYRRHGTAQGVMSPVNHIEQDEWAHRIGEYIWKYTSLHQW